MSRNFYPSYIEGCLHPESETILEQIEASNSKPLTSLSLQEARDSFLDRSWLGDLSGDVRIEPKAILGKRGAIPIRIYTCGNRPAQPILVFFHGGGFVLGKLDEFDPFCAFLAERANCIVVSVDYALAPENRFPAAVEDAEAAVEWVSDHAAEIGGDASRIAVAGDSAGANLASVVCQAARTTGLAKIVLQVLICPWIDLSDASESDASFRLFGDGLWLSSTNLRWYRNHNVETAAMANHPRVSPLRAKCLQDLPPALIITAEFDILRDQGRAYALRLTEAGIPVVFRQYPGQLHDFAILPGKFTEAGTAITQIVEALRAAFASYERSDYMSE